jgi:hypothetical protein
MKITPTTILVFVLSIGLLLVGALYVFLYQNILDKGIRVGTLTQDVVNQAEKAKHLGENKTLFDQVSTKRVALDTYFLGSRDEDTVSFLVSLEGLASSSKVALSIETPTFVPLEKAMNNQIISDSKDPVLLDKESINLGGIDSKWENLQLQIKTDGEWSNTTRLIALIESMPYKIKITQANLALVPSPDPKKKTRMWHGIFTLTVIKIK